ncbi:hypothetical protein DERP_014512 [Dermatophagoides pteronyssinus]|uniref:Uncharacterized protein n=1 Tax=Dermatophagoides pteronyssinus TaxID=6956 RepID=A0ABQ8JTP9_DERPT|nr:hypothetical protein DERP_014512 [Dermatophagoides pteronyssinus]
MSLIIIITIFKSSKVKLPSYHNYQLSTIYIFLMTISFAISIKATFLPKHLNNLDNCLEDLRHHLSSSSKIN